ncbi:hypothetical protein Tco_0432938 [Tanacetum coccineum]
MSIRFMKNDIREKCLIDVSLDQCQRAKQCALFDHEGEANEEDRKLYFMRDDLNLGDGGGISMILDGRKKRWSRLQFERLFWVATATSMETDFLQKNGRNPNSWCRAYFEMDRCSAAFEDGIFESFTSRILGARGKPIITMLEDIRVYLMERMWCMNKLAFENKEFITPSVRRQMEFNKKIQRHWLVFLSGYREVEVRRGDQSFGVNLHTMTYVCNMWQLSRIPCIHVMVRYMHMKMNPDLGVDECHTVSYLQDDQPESTRKTLTFNSIYDHLCGDLSVESLIFHNNNVVGIFGYPQTAPSYHDICKYLMNCPLAKAFTKSHTVVYQNLLRKFWCNDIASRPNPPTDDFEVCPLKEYLINFSVMNGKRPLTLDFKTFTESSGLDYAKGKYVSYSSTKEVKAELAKIIDNPILLDRTPVLKTAFPVSWRILFTFVVQVLDGNYSSTEQVNSIQQLFAYCLLTCTKVDIGEIIYNDLVTRLTNKSMQKYVSYPRFVSCALEVLLGSNYTHDESFRSSPTILITPLPFTVKKKKEKSQTVTLTLPKSQGLEASGLSGKKQPIGIGLLSMVSDEDTVKTTLLPKGPRGDKDLEGLKPPADMKPLTNLVANPSGTDDKYQPDSETLQLTTFVDVQALLLSDDDDVLKVGEEMDEDIPPTDEEDQSPPQNQE